MADESVEGIWAELERLDVRDTSAVRAFALRVESVLRGADAHDVITRSNALRRAVGQLRTEALAALLARDEREEFIRRTADETYMAPVELEQLRVPRYVAVEQHPCDCGAALFVPFDKHGGPDFPFDCPGCGAAYLAHPVYASGEYRVTVQPDLRPPKKRKRK